MAFSQIWPVTAGRRVGNEPRTAANHGPIVPKAVPQEYCFLAKPETEQQRMAASLPVLFCAHSLMN